MLFMLRNHFVVNNKYFLQIRKAFLVTILGGIIIFAFPPVYFVVTAFLGVVILSLLFFNSKSLLNSVTLGFFAGFGYGIVGFYWFYYAVNYVLQSSIISALAVCVTGILSGMFFIFISVAIYLFPKHKVWQLMLFSAVSWNLIEIVKGVFIFGGVPWNLMAEVWNGDLYMMQIASIFGVFGLSFITYLLFSSSLLIFNPYSTNKQRILCGVGIAVLLISCHVFGYIRVAKYENVSHKKIDKLVAIMQPNISQTEKMKEENDEQNINLLIKEASNLSMNYKNLLIIWPETFFNNYQDYLYNITNRLKDKLHNNATLITGVARLNYFGSNYNSVLIYNPSENYEKYYNKNHLVPFGEYIPLAGMFSYSKSLVTGFGFTAGVNSPIFQIRESGKFKVLVCFEAIFPDSQLNNSNIDFLINVANDAWYNKSLEPAQHLALIRYRAIEGGIPVLRSANTGISAVIDSTGKVVRQLGLFKQGSLLVHVPQKYRSSTIFSEIGNNLIIIFNFAIFILLFLNIIQSIRSRVGLP